MRLLVDTHVLLWCLAAPGELRPDARRALQDPDNVVFASTVSAWEMEIKHALGKLRTPSDLADGLRRLRFTELPLHLRHVRALRDLPPLHRDPFDRMLVAQACADALLLVSRDARVRRYPVECMPA